MSLGRQTCGHARYSMKGFSLIEVMLVVLILVIVTTFALMGTRNAKPALQLQTNADNLTAYLQRAFTDSSRRHALGSARSVIQVTSPNTYTVTIDMTGDGAAETRTITLTDGVTFVYTTAPVATIDWRGNVAEGTVTFVLKNNIGETQTLTLTSSGDTTDSALPGMPTVTATTTSTDLKSSVVVNGNYSPVPYPSPTAVGTPLPTCVTGTDVAETKPCRCVTGKHIDPASGKCK